MSNQIKTVKGQLLDISGNEVLLEIMVEIELILSQNDIPQYQVFGSIKSYRPDLSDKSHTLKLNEQISGEVFISIDGLPDVTETRYRIYLQGDSWNNLEWFTSLPS